MSFRGRLRVFFTIIVIVPMIAVALVLFTLTAESETGKADAGIAAALRNAFTLYDQASDRAEPVLRRVGQDRALRSALAAGRYGEAARRIEVLQRTYPSVVSIELYSTSAERLARAGSARGVAPATAPLASADGRRIGRLSVSITHARRFARVVERLSGLEVSVFRSGRRVATTAPSIPAGRELGRADRSRDFEVDGEEYRGRVDSIREPAGPPVEVAVFQPAGELSGAIADSRLLIGAILLGFLLAALASSVFVVRALQGQVGQFLSAARRLARGDFKHSVPTHGGDEFAALGKEFNSMSEQLEAKIEEVERKRRELEETIRRVGAAFASGLDRQGIVELAVETAVDACGAEAGRAVPIDGVAFRATGVGRRDGAVSAALDSAERSVFTTRRGDPADRGDRSESGDSGRERRRAVEAGVDGAHALAVAMRARLGSGASAQNVGVLSIAREGAQFAREDSELLEYLAGQVAVSIENSDLHDTVQRQAVTDELTGLSNVRKLHTTLDGEVERSRRFRTPLGLVMLDIDDFKRLNDEFGHQQGDEVLTAVGRVLHDHSRDIDEPARYGGEELCVVLPQTSAEGAEQLAERMREAIERLRIPRIGEDGEPLRVTASFGVASIPDTAEDKRSLVAAADAALYRAKRAGKNRVERAEPMAASR